MAKAPTPSDDVGAALGSRVLDALQYKGFGTAEKSRCQDADMRTANGKINDSLNSNPTSRHKTFKHGFTARQNVTVMLFLHDDDAMLLRIRLLCGGSLAIRRRSDYRTCATHNPA